MTSLPLGLRPRGLTWSVLRLHRPAVWAWSAFVVILALGLTRLHLLGENAEGVTGPCGGEGMPVCSAAFHEASSEFAFRYTSWAGLASGILAWLPLVVAAWASAALVARELENGTASLAWTQSVSPARWLATRLAVPALLLTLGTLALTALFRWTWVTGDPDLRGDWYMSDVYRAMGPVTTAYVLLALAVGAVAGVLTRRTLPSVGAGAGAMLAVYGLAEEYRFALWPKTVWTGHQAAVLPNSTRVDDFGLITTSGEQLSRIFCDSDHPKDYTACLNRHDAVGAFGSGHPASDFLPLQLMETGTVLTLTAALAATAFWLLRWRLP